MHEALGPFLLAAPFIGGFLLVVLAVVAGALPRATDDARVVAGWRRELVRVAPGLPYRVDVVVAGGGAHVLRLVDPTRHRDAPLVELTVGPARWRVALAPHGRVEARFVEDAGAGDRVVARFEALVTQTLAMRGRVASRAAGTTAGGTVAVPL